MIFSSGQYQILICFKHTNQIFLLINKELKQKFEEFKSESIEERKRRGIKVIMYIVISVIMLMLSIASPLCL